MAEDCIFCKINAGEIPSEILYRDDVCFVIRDIAPKAQVHLLIIPSDHFTYLTNAIQDHKAMLGNLFLAAQQMAEKEGIAESGFRLVVNQRDDSGQEVPHLHVHLLGGQQLRAMG